MDTVYLDTTVLTKAASSLRAGDRLFLSGVVYTARDAAHKRMVQAMEKGQALPFALKGATIYYAGPTPTKPGGIVGSCGPTTSARMDPYTPQLLKQGLSGMIGKGGRSQATIQAIIEAKAIYLCALGGAGALAAKCVRQLEMVAYADLGCESVKRMVIADFPLIVGIDCQGGTIFG